MISSLSQNFDETVDHELSTSLLNAYNSTLNSFHTVKKAAEMSSVDGVSLHNDINYSSLPISPVTNSQAESNDTLQATSVSRLLSTTTSVLQNSDILQNSATLSLTNALAINEENSSTKIDTSASNQNTSTFILSNNRSGENVLTTGTAGIGAEKCCNTASLSVSASTHMSVSASTHMSVSASTHMSVSASTHMSVSASTHMSVSASTQIALLVNASVMSTTNKFSYETDTTVTVSDLTAP